MKRQCLMFLVVGPWVVACTADVAPMPGAAGEDSMTGGKSDNVGESLYQWVSSGEQVAFDGRILDGSFHQVPRESGWETAPIPSADGCIVRFEKRADHVAVIVSAPTSDAFGSTLQTASRIPQPTDGSLQQLDFTADDFAFQVSVESYEPGRSHDYSGQFDAQTGTLTLVEAISYASTARSVRGVLELQLTDDRSGVSEFTYTARWNDEDHIDTRLACRFDS